MARQCVIGVDLGGTNVRAQAIFEDGSPAGEYRKGPSHAQQGSEAIVDALTNTIREAMHAADAKVAAVGMAVPGHIDSRAGVVRWAPNFGRDVEGVFISWRDVPLKRVMEERLELPVSMGNDANLAALGEYLYGCGKNEAKCLVMLTVGTGIGGGVVLKPDAVMGDARGPLVLIGGNGGGAELGHIIVQAGGMDASAGAYGSLEAYCQRDAIVQRARYKLQREPDVRGSKMWELVEGNLARITPQIIAIAASQGDDLAMDVYAEIGAYMGVGVGSLINIFAPDVVAIGGQIAKAGEPLMAPLVKSAKNTAIPTLFESCEIRLAQLLDDAGILGAAAMGFEERAKALTA